MDAEVTEFTEVACRSQDRFIGQSSVAKDGPDTLHCADDISPRRLRFARVTVSRET
jgi:hypothetical protein